MKYCHRSEVAMAKPFHRALSLAIGFLGYEGIADFGLPPPASVKPVAGRQ